MPACPSCAAANPEGFRFCGRCGTPLGAMSCPSCGASNAETQRFCGHCGHVLGTGPDAGTDGGATSVEERKLATVLFADVVGFTSLAERTDPEVVMRMVDAALERVGQVVTEHGGTVDKLMGDGLMAVFGVPVAHDDDAERAVAAGLAIRRLGGDLVFSIGVNSGEVMVAALAGGDVTVIGDTVNVAARLEKAAGPGEVLCGRLTTELAAGRVDFAERQPVLLKGKREPVSVWEALRLRRSGDGGVGERAPLVGREEELTYLDMQWRRVRDDRQAKLVVLCGEAGSGKSRLLDELACVIGDEALVVRAAYPAYGVMGGLQVAAELIAQLGPSDDAEVEKRVRSVLGELDPSLRALDAAGVGHEQIWALGQLLKEKAADRPLVIMVDDLHSADARTLELLGELAVRIRDVPLFTVAAGRSEPGHWLTRFAAATTVRVTALSRPQSAALARALVGDKPLAGETQDLLVEMTGGNPLYLRELVSMARSRGLLVDEGDAFRLTAPAGIPATLQALLASRLDALDRPQKLALQHLAVLGEATVGELGALGGGDVRGVVDWLLASALVRSGGDGRLELADPLLREVAYEMLPRTARGDLHRRAAGVVERTELRARHLERAAEYLVDDAGLAADAAEALAVEGEALAEASRPVEAMGVLERAVALGLRRPSVLLDLARLQAVCGKEDEAIVTLGLVADDPADPSLVVERDHTAAATHIFTAPARSLPGLAEAAERWHQLGNTGKEAWAHANRGVAFFYLSQMEESATELETALAAFDSIGDRAGAVAVTSFLCLARPEDPRVDQWLDEALHFAAETGDRNRQVATLVTMTWQQFFRSFCGTAAETAAAEDLAVRLVTLAEEMHVMDMAVHGWSLLTLMTRLTGRLEEAERHAASLKRAVAAGYLRDPWLAWAADFSVAVATGSPGAAPPFPPRESVDPVVTVAGLVVQTELLLAGRLEEALARIEEIGAPPLEGALADVGGLVYGLTLVLSGRGEDAHPWLVRAGRAPNASGDRPAASAAAALDAEGGHAPRDIPAVGERAGGIAEALALRARVACGDSLALQSLRDAAKALSAPGLLAGLA